MIVLGYACLGLLVGILAGLTSSPIATTVLAAIFTLAGGSILPLTKNSDSERKLVGSLLTGFALLCLVGVLGGIYIKINQTLGTPVASAGPPADASEITSAVQTTATPVVYFKAAELTKINEINTKYRNGDLSPSEAYQQLWELVRTSSK